MTAEILSLDSLNHLNAGGLKSSNQVIVEKNWPIMIEAKYAEIRNLIIRGTFRSVLRTELPDGANLITARHALSIRKTKIKKKDIQRDTLPAYIWIS